MKIDLSNALISLLRLFLFNLCVAVAVCSVTSVAVAGENTYDIIEVAKADVEAQGCHYVGEVWGISSGKSSKWNRLSAPASKLRAENKALMMAAELNATHLVWSEQAEGSNSHRQVYANAYRCDTSVKSSEIAKKGSNGRNQIN